MEILVQHNLKNGLGDFTNGMRRYFHFVEGIKKRKFARISLYVNMKESIMFDKNFYFKLYNKTLLENWFDEIIISDVPITESTYNGLTHLDAFGLKEIGVHQYDVFVETTSSVFPNFINNLQLFFSENETSKFINFFSDFVMERYDRMNIHKNEEYKSLHFRAQDFHDNVDLYIDHEDEFKDIIFNKGKIFVSSNSYKFKEYIKSFNSPNVFMYDLPFEKDYGNHVAMLPFNDKFGKTEYEDRTIDAAVESLTISDSNEVFSFNYFGNVHSNFLNIAKLKSVDIKIIALKNGMNWIPSMS